MTDRADELERRIDQLRTALRAAVRTAEQDRVRALRAELRAAEHAWHGLFNDDGDGEPAVTVEKLLPPLSIPQHWIRAL